MLVAQPIIECVGVIPMQGCGPGPIPRPQRRGRGLRLDAGRLARRRASSATPRRVRHGSRRNPLKNGSFPHLRAPSASSPPPPTARHADAQEQPDAGEPTDQHGRDGSVEIGSRDRGGHRESDDPAEQGPGTITNREPPHLGRGRNGRADSNYSSHDRSGNQSRLSSCVAQDGPDYGPKPGETPRSGEQSKRLQETWSPPEQMNSSE
jgi:hypothetical protein